MCKACKNTWSAAKRGHFSCLQSCLKEKGWDERTTQGAMENGNREWFDLITDMDPPRSKKECVLAAKWGWRDIIVRHMHELTIKEKYLISSICIQAGHFDLFIMFENTPYTKDEKLKMLMTCVMSGNLNDVKYLQQLWNLDMTQQTERIYSCAISSGNVDMFDYIMYDQKCPHWGAYQEMLFYAIKQSKPMFDRTIEFIRFNHGFESISPNVKRTCLAFKQAEYLQIIHNYIPSWPDNFLSDARSYGRYHPSRDQMIAFALSHGCEDPGAVDKSSDLHKMMSIIDDVEMPEGKYLELCTLMKRLHQSQ